VFEHTQPRARGPHSIHHAAIGDRLRGDGCERARLLWLMILSHTPWRAARRPTWASNVTLSHESGLDERRVRLGLQRLREAGMLATAQGERPGARRRVGRILAPAISAPVKVLIPGRGAMTNLWITCRESRPRPAALVTAMVGAYALAAHALDEHPEKWSPVPGPAADLRRFVGASKGSTWGKRVNDLCDLGLLERRSGLWVAPPREWMQGWRALR